MVGGVAVNFVLEAPLFGTPGFLVSAASYSGQIGLAALLGLVTEALWVGIAVAMPVFGHDVVFPMLAPLGLSQLLLAVWLITKGFRGQPGAKIEPSEA